MTADRSEDMIWQDVPPQALARNRNYGTAYAQQAERLKLTPGRSAIIRQFELDDYDNARQLTNSVKRGRIKAFQPGGTFDALTHTEGGMVNVYAWFIAEDGTGAGS